MDSSLTDIIVELHVPNFDTVKNFYAKLGFEVVWEKEPHLKKGYLVMKRGKSVLAFFCGNDHVYDHTYFKKFPRNTLRGYGVEIAIPTEDIENLFSAVKNLLPNSIVESLVLQSWGKKDFRIVDPFGYYLRFTEPINILSK